MRIVQKHQTAPAPEPPQTDDQEEYISESPPKVPVIVSGVVTKGDKDFTPAAAQVAHQKPQPCVPKLPPAQHINQHIHQPRKWARQQAPTAILIPPANLPNGTQDEDVSPPGTDL